jgi:hypothetical protein
MPLPNFKFWLRDETSADSIVESFTDIQPHGNDKIRVTESGRAVNADSDLGRDDKPAEQAQEGVKKAEATAIVWTKSSLVIVFLSYALGSKISSTLE